MKLRFPVCSLLAGKRVEQGLTILDLHGFTMGQINKRVYHFVQIASKIGQDYYPEIMGQLLIVDSPWVFSGVYAVVKGFLDPKTRKKIQIVGSKYQKQLLELVDEDKLPKFLGGACECPEGCLKSDVGPWKQYKVLEPVGIEKLDGEPTAPANKKEEEKAPTE